MMSGSHATISEMPVNSKNIQISLIGNLSPMLFLTCSLSKVFIAIINPKKLDEKSAIYIVCYSECNAE